MLAAPRSRASWLGAVLHIDGVAFVAALGEAVDERDRMALGAAVDQRAGDENEPHAAFLLVANWTSRGRCAGACTSAMTAAPTATRTRGACAANSHSAIDQAAAPDKAATPSRVARRAPVLQRAAARCRSDCARAPQDQQAIEVDREHAAGGGAGQAEELRRGPAHGDRDGEGDPGHAQRVGPLPQQHAPGCPSRPRIAAMPRM